MPNLIIEQDLTEAGYTVYTVENRATAGIPHTPAPTRVWADHLHNDASARVFVSGWGDADGLVLTQTRHLGVTTTRTDDTPAELLAAARAAAALVDQAGGR